MPGYAAFAAGVAVQRAFSLFRSTKEESKAPDFALYETETDTELGPEVRPKGGEIEYYSGQSRLQFSIYREGKAQKAAEAAIIDDFHRGRDLRPDRLHRGAAEGKSSGAEWQCGRHSQGKKARTQSGVAVAGAYVDGATTCAEEGKDSAVLPRTEAAALPVLHSTAR